MWKFIIPRKVDKCFEDQVKPFVKLTMEPFVNALKTYKPVIEEMQGDIDELYSLGQVQPSSILTEIKEEAKREAPKY